MKETRFFYVPNAGQENEMPTEEALHALRVLRIKSGDEINLMDGVGNFYRAEVTLAATKRCLYEVKEVLPQQPAWHGHVHLAIAPTKVMDRIEWMAEKATEIGFDELSFLNCKFSERKTMRTVRLDKIVISAVKQSHKAWKPIVNQMVSFKEFIAQPRKGRKFICHCFATAFTCKINHILHRNAFLAVWANLSWNLKSSTTDTTALNFNLRSNIIKSCLPYFKCRLLFVCHFLLYYIKCFVKNFI